MSKVTSFLAACKLLKKNPEELPVVKHLDKLHAEALVAQFQLWTIADAIRDGWVPDYNNTDQQKWYAVFYFIPSKKKGGEPRLAFNRVNYWHRSSDVGSRLCFEKSEDAEYFGKKFIKLHEKVHRIDH